MKTQKQQQFEDWDYHVRNNPINKLYEAAKKARTRLGQLKVRTTGTKTVILDMDDYQVVMDVYSYLDQIISAYEQEQPEAIAGEKTIDEIWKEWCEKDISWTDAALGAMRDFASQQTSAKDKEIEIQQAHIDDQDQLIFDQTKEIADLSGELHATDKLNQELQDEIAELKQRISAIKEKLPDNKIRDLNPIWVRDEIISELEKQKLYESRSY